MRPYRPDGLGFRETVWDVDIWFQRHELELRSEADMRACAPQPLLKKIAALAEQRGIGRN